MNVEEFGWGAYPQIIPLSELESRIIASHRSSNDARGSRVQTTVRF